MRILLKLDLSDRTARTRFEKVCMAIDGVKDGEIWRDRAKLALKDDASPERVVASLAAAGFDARIDAAVTSTTVAIDGMTCRSCEVTVEQRFKKLPGVSKVRVDAANGFATLETDGRPPDIRDLAHAVKDDGYVVRQGAPRPSTGTRRPSWLELAALFGGVLLLGRMLQTVGFFSIASDATLAGGAGFAAAALIGLVAGSSSCMAVSGGLMLGMAGKYRERRGASRGFAHMTPVFAFVAGRVGSYAVLGGVIGTLGNALAPSPLATGAITVFAAFVMIVLGLDILGLAPAWLKGVMPRMPKAFARKLIDSEGREHPLMPALLGGATFFIPCGFTQALQIFVLTAGGFAQGAAILGGFAVGTAPALLALGWASSSLEGNLGKLFLKFSGAVVVVLGLWNVQNGLTVAGHPLSLPSWPSAASAQPLNAAGDSGVTTVDGKQELKMRLTDAAPYYAPSDRFEVVAGVPVRLVINGVGTGCRSLFQIPKLGVSLPLTKAVNMIEFTPQDPGELTFSCAMGMYRGTLVVKPKA